MPEALQAQGDRSVPALCFRAADSARALPVTLRRNALQPDALKFRVTTAQLTTLFSPTGSFLTAVNLTVAIAEKSTLRLRAPRPGGRLYSVPK